MFNKIFFKISIYCTVAVLLVLFLSGIISSFFISNNYYNDILNDLNSLKESNFSDYFNYTLNSNMEENIKFTSIENKLFSYYGNLEIDENRKIYILNEDFSVIIPSVNKGTNIPLTENILAVKNNKKNKNFYFKDYKDAILITETTNGGKYYFYINDNNAKLRKNLSRNIIIHFWMIIPSLLIAFLIGFLISRQINIPIKKITKRAEALEKGELSENLDYIKINEFKELTNAVNHMGFFMAESIRQMNSDKHRVEVILEHINNGIITFDTKQKPIQINSAAKRILKLKDDKIVFDEFFKELGIDVKMGEFLFLEKSRTIEKEITKDKGKIKVFFIPFKMDSERNAGVVCVFEDVTEQFNVMTAMRKFVADVSHELKTPITVISSYIETVLNGYLDDKAMTTTLLNTVYRETEKMTELVQNLLDISKYETNSMTLKTEPFSIDEMLTSLVDTFKFEAQKKELSLTYNRMTDIPEFIGSRNDIERAVKNIISNSIKYTSKGDKISIFSGKLHNEIYIKVEDTGWGIPGNKLGRLFERFYRVEEEARSRDKGGTGLGLSISKEIIENHKGKIKIESEYTKYTRVTITLPIPKKEQ